MTVPLLNGSSLAEPVPVKSYAAWNFGIFCFVGGGGGGGGATLLVGCEVVAAG